MPALHAFAASRSFGVPSAARFASTRSAILFVIQGWVALFYMCFFVGTQSSAESPIRFGKYIEAVSGVMAVM